MAQVRGSPPPMWKTGVEILQVLVLKFIFINSFCFKVPNFWIISLRHPCRWEFQLCTFNTVAFYNARQLFHCIITSYSFSIPSVHFYFVPWGFLFLIHTKVSFIHSWIFFPNKYQFNFLSVSLTHWYHLHLVILFASWI